jgi:hypothetical protein
VLWRNRSRLSNKALNATGAARPRVNAKPFDGPPIQVVVRIVALAIVAIASAGGGPDLGERNIGMNGASGGAG